VLANVRLVALVAGEIVISISYHRRGSSGVSAVAILQTAEAVVTYFYSSVDYKQEVLLPAPR